MSETQAVFIAKFLFVLFGLVLGYAFYKEFSDKKNNPEYLKEYGLEPKKPDPVPPVLDSVELKKPEEKINLLESIEASIEALFASIGALFWLILYLGFSVFVFACIGILGYAVIIFLIKFVRSNLTL